MISFFHRATRFNTISNCQFSGILLHKQDERLEMNLKKTRSNKIKVILTKNLSFMIKTYRCGPKSVISSRHGKAWSRPLSSIRMRVKLAITLRLSHLQGHAWRLWEPKVDTLYMFMNLELKNSRDPGTVPPSHPFFFTTLAATGLLLMTIDRLSGCNKQKYPDTWVVVSLLPLT